MASLDILEQGLPDLIRRLERASLKRLTRDFDNWDRARTRRLPDTADEPTEYRLLHFLLFEIEERLEDIYYLRGARVEFENRYAHAGGESDRRHHVLEFARELGAAGWRLFGDRTAFKRWFGRDAVLDRVERRLGANEQGLHFVLERLGTLAAAFLAAQPDDATRHERFRRLAPDKKLEPLLTYDGDARVQHAAFSALADILAQLTVGNRESMVKANVLRYIYRSALDYKHDTWLQCEALELLQHLSAESFSTSVRTRLSTPRPGDDLFVRRRAVQLAARNARRLPELGELLRECLDDPSPFVRQGLARAIWLLDAPVAVTLFERIAHHDSTASVRAAALLELPGNIAASTLVERCRGILLGVLERESDPFVIRVALRTIVECHAALSGSAESDAAQWRCAMMPALGRLHREGEPLGVRRWAARARERLWCQSTEERREALALLEALADDVTPGRGRRMPPSQLGRLDAPTLARIASVATENDFTLSFKVKNGRPARIYRGQRFGIRTWRWLHELRHAATDKRQAFSHTVGRIFFGTYRAPAGYLAEQTETRVPGEPVYVEDEDGWRPYLPLVDEAISCLDEAVGSATVFLYTAEGVTELSAPPSFAARVYARSVLTWRFAHYARLRNGHGGAASPKDYIEALERLGFRIRFRSHEDEDETGTWSGDPRVAYFFPAAIGVLDPGILTDLKQYFFSVYENTIYELALFLFAVASITLGRHAVLGRLVRRARGRIPVVIGGWGTRGKSGTERMKAALFSAMGYNVISKTTGTEAMFLQCHRFGSLREMFLFRPYDKATIWEQVNVLRYGADCGADVFLWECMGLTPSYVSVLAQDWMKDDLSTITNTYPDHEDLQGPAGINIPEVMTEFIPADATLVTSEEHMLPILRDAATRRNTSTVGVGWLETGLVTEDVLERFPYEEHPANVALVQALSRQLGVADDFVLKEIADHIVPDLGVLKTFPVAALDGCRLQFINGMAANERLGFMGNWRRVGFAAQDPDAEPGTWITTLINNRADRVPRSRVFADILVRDITADRHYLIGTNLHGFIGYLEESWADLAEQYTLADEAHGGAWPEKLRADAARMRVAVEKTHIRARVAAMLAGLGIEFDDDPPAAALVDPERLAEILSAAGHEALAERAAAYCAGLQRESGALRELCDELEAAQRRGEDVAPWNKRAVGLLWQCLRSRIVVIEDPDIDGDSIIRRIAESTPPGYRNQILGCQNIKGPGLDFVYRWQAWEACHRACEEMKSGDAARVDLGLNALLSFQEFGPLSAQLAAETLAAVRGTEVAQTESFQSRIQVVEANLFAQLAAGRSAGEPAPAGSLLLKFAHVLETFFDAGDAIRRRKRADRIYRDLVTMRISRARAVVELQQLNKRQKGGWMTRRMRALLRPRSSAPADA